MKRRTLALAAVLAVAACEGGESPIGPTLDFDVDATIVDGGTTAVLSGVFYFQEPIQVSPPIPSGATADTSLEPEVRIDGPGYAGPETFPFGKGGGKVKQDGMSYKLNWATGNLTDGMYTVEVLLDGEPIGSVDLDIDGRDVTVLGEGNVPVRVFRLNRKPSRTIPVQFWLGEGADFVADRINQDCYDDVGDVIDCDTETWQDGDPDPVIEVFDLENVGLPPAAKVIVDPNSVIYDKTCLINQGADLNDPNTWPAACERTQLDIQLFHISQLSQTPSLTQYPYYVGLNVLVGGTGGGGDALVDPPLQFYLCQSEDVENQLGGQVQDLNIARASGTTTQIIQTSLGTSGFCEQNTSTAYRMGPADGDQGILGKVLDRVASAVAWVAPRPLHATAAAVVSHGGLRGALPGASEFYATLGEADAPLQVMQGGTTPINTDVSTLEGEDDASTYYSYGVGSGVPGASSGIPLAQSNTSLLYIYENEVEDEVEGAVIERTLIILHDAINDDSGGKADFLIEGRQVSDIVVFDDALTSGDSYTDETATALRAVWVWNDTNTDGAAISLDGATSITITPDFPATGGLSAGQITSWKFLTGDLSNPTEVILDPTQDVTITVGGGSP